MGARRRFESVWVQNDPTGWHTSQAVSVQSNLTFFQNLVNVRQNLSDEPVFDSPENKSRWLLPKSSFTASGTLLR